MRAFLAMAPEHEKGGVVLLGEEFEARGVLEGVDGVFLRKAQGVRAFQGV